MKSFLPIVTIALFFASCTTAYKSGQTPDDVYYSPARPVDEYDRHEERTSHRQEYDAYAEEDRYLRMKIRNRNRWSVMDNDWTTYNRYYSGYYSYNTPWNYYSSWNYFYNPYYNHNYVIVGNPRTPVYNTPRRYNLNVFDNPQTNQNNNPKTSRYYGAGSSSSNNNYRGSGSNAGRYIRESFGTSGNSGSSSTSSSPNSGTPKSSSSGSSSSSSSGSSSSGRGGNAPVRRF